mmetsp:Transcript_3966/g.9281  ORF Transcript_3966/g.9281 Transcript_3966/m.9281 type:complete len:177 (-) Transcript_3966:174-704(-)
MLSPADEGPGRPWALCLVFCLITMGLLEGCGPTPSCKIADVYPKLQVNGRTGLSRLQLAHAGVWLCARHSAKRETYKGAEACSEPEEVFTNGELPDILAGDVQALLLVRCPSLTYPGGQIMQRVTCSRDYYFAEPDGPLEQELSIHFDGNRKADNCRCNSTGWEESHKTGQHVRRG